ncbi:MAG: hypothetical protein Phog2KO_49330 [Phototrophicaceae bacterium]
MSNKVSVALIGAGYTATEHAKVFADLPDAEIVGIHSNRRESAEAFASEHNIPNVYDSIEALYEGTKADIVLVTVYETSMKAVCLKCIEYPWTLFVEKPPGMNVDEAEEILAGAEANDRDVYVALNRRFYGSTLAAVDGLAEIDEPRYIYIQDQEDRDTALAVGQPEIVVQHWMYANSIHMVDFAYIFGRGDVVEVKPIFPLTEAHPRVITSAITFSSGDRVIYEAVWEAPAPWSVSITTSQKRWELRPVEDASYQNAGERQRHTLERPEVDTKFKPGFWKQAEQVVKKVQGEESASISLKESLKTMRLIREIYGE